MTLSSVLRRRSLLAIVVAAIGVVMLPTITPQPHVAAQTSSTATGTPGTATPAATPAATATAVPTAAPLPFTSFFVCGPITAYTAATATTGGSITIAGTSLPLAANVSITGSPSVLVVGNTVCLIVTSASNGAVVSSIVSATTATTPTFQVCGVVTAFTAATAAAAGTITIGGFIMPIAMATTFTGTAPTVGSSICLSATIGATGALIAGTFTAAIPTAAKLAETDAGMIRVGRLLYAG